MLDVLFQEGLFLEMQSSLSDEDYVSDKRDQEVIELCTKYGYELDSKLEEVVGLWMNVFPAKFVSDAQKYIKGQSDNINELKNNPDVITLDLWENDCIMIGELKESVHKIGEILLSDVF